MAKELPYFKFEPNEWQSGMIQVCSFEAKGLFIELCSLYWSRLGDLPYALALQKLCNGNASLMQELESNQIYEVENNQIVISFLDEQLNEFQQTSEKRRKAANKRWKDSSAMQVHSKSNAIREDNIREEKTRKEKIKDIEDRKREFYNSLIPYLSDYSKQTLKDFYEYWTEHSPNQRKFRAEKEKAFDLNRRLKKWKENEERFTKNRKPGTESELVRQLSQTDEWKHL